MSPYEKLPIKYRSGIENWIQNGIQPGGFLCAVLKNDHRDAVMRADDTTTLADFRDILRFLYNNAPDTCSGSVECFDTWPARLEGRRSNGHQWNEAAGCWESNGLDVAKE